MNSSALTICAIALLGAALTGCSASANQDPNTPLAPPQQQGYWAEPGPAGSYGSQPVPWQQQPPPGVSVGNGANNLIPFFVWPPGQATGHWMRSDEEITAPENSWTVIESPYFHNGQCNNVGVTNLYMEGMGTDCRVTFYPERQGLKAGQSTTATVTISGHTFTIKVTAITAIPPSIAIIPFGAPAAAK
jgi:hypothetical protein